MSTEAVLRSLAKHAAPNCETVQNDESMMVACFSRQALINALREFPLTQALLAGGAGSSVKRFARIIKIAV
jgi:hypothetical protein